LLCGYPPFNASTPKAIMERVLEGTFSLDGPEWRMISAEAKLFIKKMLAYNPKERFNNQYLSRASHPGPLDPKIQQS
jgi:serine/threonine protein kinase